MSLPARHPLDGPDAWWGGELVQSERWTWHLSPKHEREIDLALDALMVEGWRIGEIPKTRFVLPTLSAMLVEIGEELENGCGIARLKGLSVGAYNDQELQCLWLGIGAHIGRPLYQDPFGLLLREICDEGPDVGTRFGQLESAPGKVFLSSRARALSRAALRFHTDRADVAALLCLGQARSGGVSKLASSVTVHNQMLDRRPELAELLYDVIYRSRLGEEYGGENMLYTLPVFGVRDHKFTSHYSRTFVEAAQTLDGVPRMSDVQWEALDLLAELAEASCFEMRLEPGDMQFINNHVVYHARTAFEDAEDAGYKRRLYRLWLCPPNNRALPIGHEVLWRNVNAGGLRGGIAQAAGPTAH